MLTYTLIPILVVAVFLIGFLIIRIQSLWAEIDNLQFDLEYWTGSSFQMNEALIRLEQEKKWLKDQNNTLKRELADSYTSLYLVLHNSN